MLFRSLVPPIDSFAFTSVAIPSSAAPRASSSRARRARHRRPHQSEPSPKMRSRPIVAFLAHCRCVLPSDSFLSGVLIWASLVSARRARWLSTTSSNSSGRIGFVRYPSIPRARHSSSLDARVIPSPPIRENFPGQLAAGLGGHSILKSKHNLLSYTPVFGYSERSWEGHSGFIIDTRYL